jgi:hypothetical protein
MAASVEVKDIARQQKPVPCATAGFLRLAHRFCVPLVESLCEKLLPKAGGVDTPLGSSFSQ